MGSRYNSFTIRYIWLGRQMVKPPLQRWGSVNISVPDNEDKQFRELPNVGYGISTGTSANPEGYCLNGGSNPLRSHN